MLTSKEKQGHGPQSVDRIRVTANYSGRYQLSDVLLPDKGIQSGRDDNTKCRQNAQISLTGHPENRTGKQIRAALFLPSKKGIFFQAAPWLPWRNQTGDRGGACGLCSHSRCVGSKSIRCRRQLRLRVCSGTVRPWTYLCWYIRRERIQLPSASHGFVFSAALWLHETVPQ